MSSSRLPLITAAAVAIAATAAAGEPTGPVARRCADASVTSVVTAGPADS